MTNSSTLKAESPLEENTLSQEAATEKFGEALVDEVQAEFAKDAQETFAAETAVEETIAAQENVPVAAEENSLPETEFPLEENTLSQEAATEKFGEALVDEVQAEFAKDAQETFAAETAVEETIAAQENVPVAAEENSLPETEFPLEENTLSQEAATEKFGEALVDEVQAEFAEDAQEIFVAETAVEETVVAQENVPVAADENVLTEAESPLEENTLSQEAATEKFGEALVDEVQAEFAKDVQETFEMETVAEKESLKTDHLLSDAGIQALLSVFWEGFQHPEAERKEFFKEVLSQEEFRFFPLLADPMKLSLLPLEAEEKQVLENNFGKVETNLSFEYAKGLAQITLQMGTLRELRRNALALLSWCIGLFSISALFAAIIFTVPHLSQGKATFLAFLLTVPVITIILAVASLGRVWEYFTFIQGSGEPSQAASNALLSDSGNFLSKGIAGIEEKLTENKAALLRVSNALEQAVQRLILSGCLIAFSTVIWLSLSIAATFQKFLSWEHVGFFVLTCFILFLTTFFVRIGNWKAPSAGRNWGWCFALVVFVFTLFGAGAIGRGPIRVNPNEMPEISSSWIHNFSPNGFFEGLRGWFYPGVALQWVPPKS
ncbi:hypothetical protein FAI41_01655 [Acetobacteraceae bacterium]|nr:hypothetical protein FAI41_01655 [Acetobacteraceae bacterium]